MEKFKVDEYEIFEGCGISRAGFKIYKLNITVDTVNFDLMDDTSSSLTNTFTSKEAARKAGIDFINSKVRYMYMRYFYGDYSYDNFYKQFTDTVKPKKCRKPLFTDGKIIINFTIDEYDPLFYNEYTKYADQYTQMAKYNEIMQPKYITYLHDRYGHERGFVNKF